MYHNQEFPTDAPPIFGAEAPKYWAKNIPVIPLKYHSKAAFLKNWSALATKMPSPEQQYDWLEKYSSGNIGVVTGPTSNLTLIDVDYDGEGFTEILLEILPDSPWTRVGAKGFVWAYRHNPNISNFKIHAELQGDTKPRTLVECMSSGQQVVLPPSIHPDTQEPYVANQHLLDVYDSLPVLPDDVEKQLRIRLQEAGFSLSVHGAVKYSKYVSSGQRDSTMTGLAGGMAGDVLRGRLTLQEAADQMQAWATTLVEKVAGDELDPEKAVNTMLKFVVRDMERTKRPLPLGWDRDITPDLREYMSKHVTEDSEEWSFDKIREYARKEFSKKGVGLEGEKLKVLEKLVTKVVRNSSFTEAQRDHLYRYLADAAAVVGITPASLKRQSRDITTIELPGTDHTQIAQHAMERLNEQGELRFHEGLFWQWKGSHWEVKPEYEILRYLATEYGELPAMKKSHDHKGVMTVIASLCTASLETYDRPGINFANGYLLPEGKLVGHDPEYGARYTLPYRYVPELSDRCPRFLGLLNDFWGKDPDREQKIHALQEAMAASLFGVSPVYQRAFLLYGLPSTGKSRILRIMEGLLPMEVKSSVSPEVWSDKFLPAELVGKLLNICGEIHETSKISGKHFKEIVEGSEILGQFKGKQPFRFKPRCAHWFAGNHLPKTRDSSAGFSRRFLIFEFNEIVSPSKKNPMIAEEILTDELEPIVAWVVEGMKRLSAGKDYTVPPSHAKLVDEMAAFNNTVRFFFQECVNLRFNNHPSVRGHTHQADSTVGKSQDTNPSQLVNESNSAGTDLEGDCANSINGVQAVTNTSTSYSVPTPPTGTNLSGSKQTFFTLEEDIYHEYYAFSRSKSGSVKPVGIREFRSRVKEIKGDYGIEVKEKRLKDHQSGRVGVIYEYFNVKIAPPSEDG